MAYQLWKDIRRGVAATAYRYPDAKIKTKDATNTDPWGPTEQQKTELCHACLHPEDRQIIFKALWKRCQESREFWIQIYKALDVFEFFLLMGLHEAENELRQNEPTLLALMEYHGAGGKSGDKDDEAAARKKEEANEKVRAKARRMLLLLTDGAALHEEREKLHRTQARVSGEQGSVGSSNVNEKLRSVSPTSAYRGSVTPPRSRSPPSIVPLSSILPPSSPPDQRSNNNSDIEAVAVARRSNSPSLTRDFGASSSSHPLPTAAESAPPVVRSDTLEPSTFNSGKQPQPSQPQPRRTSFLDMDDDDHPKLVPLIDSPEQPRRSSQPIGGGSAQATPRNQGFDPFDEANQQPKPNTKKTVLYDFTGSTSTPPQECSPQSSTANRPGVSPTSSSHGNSPASRNTPSASASPQSALEAKMLGFVDGSRRKSQNQETLETVMNKQKQQKW